MSSLSAIPIRVESAGLAGAGIGGGIAALLSEIASHLEGLAAGGEPAAIDLRGLPMSAAERQRLREALGPGEVRIVLEAAGESSIEETAVQGVWWIEHRTPDGALIASYIEIARVPGILIVPDEELARGAAKLRNTAEFFSGAQGESLHGTT